MITLAATTETYIMHHMAAPWEIIKSYEKPEVVRVGTAEAEVRIPDTQKMVTFELCPMHITDFDSLRERVTADIRQPLKTELGERPESRRYYSTNDIYKKLVIVYPPHLLRDSRSEWPSNVRDKYLWKIWGFKSKNQFDEVLWAAAEAILDRWLAPVAAPPVNAAPSDAVRTIERRRLKRQLKH